MVWITLTFVFFWLLCGAWALRMDEKDSGCLTKNPWPYYYYIGGLLIFMVVWCLIWPDRIGKFIWEFGKGIVSAWKQASKGGTDANAKNNS